MCNVNTKKNKVYLIIWRRPKSMFAILPSPGDKKCQIRVFIWTEIVHHWYPKLTVRRDAQN